MEIYLIKSVACLAIFYCFYKIVLEQARMHVLKRFYLLGSLLAALLIPLITFTTYVETTASEALPTMAEVISETPISELAGTNYLIWVLWSIYFFGVFFFGTRFLKNIRRMILKIQNNPKIKKNRIYHVLLKSAIIPHSFFSYIFLNKAKYESQEIPEEVLIHEETHARELHSLDIVFIEIMQIVFWFNPLLYFIKHSIKLNHEFLADSGVLRKGVDTYNYQNILLAFSSNASAPQLASSINYSFIKKRFTVMKKQTSKKGIWLRSLLLVPLMSLLIYGFSTTEIIERPSEEILSGIASVSANEELEVPILEISEDPIQYKLNNNKTALSTLNEDFRKITNGQKTNLQIKTKGAIKMSLIKKIHSILDENIDKILLLQGAHIEDDLYDLTSDKIDFDHSEKATKEEIHSYNGLAKKYNAIDISKRKIPLSDLNILETIFRKMTATQKESAQPFPECLPKNSIAAIQQKDLMIQVELSKIRVNGKPSSLKTFAKDVDAVTKSWEETDYTSIRPNVLIASTPKEFLDKVDVQFRKTHFSKANGGVGVIPPPPPPPPAPSATLPKAPHKVAGRVIKGVNDQSPDAPPPPPPPVNASPEMMKNYKEAVAVYNQNVQKQSEYDQKKYQEQLAQVKAYNEQLKAQGKSLKGQVAAPPPPPPPPPPAPEEPLDHIISMAKKGATFYYEGKKVSSDRAIQLIKNNESLNIQTTESNSSNPQVKISTKPIKVN